ncbi:DNA-binding PucR family transcriptional regulator [Kribbella sp. VKM Ac-2571]|uniref:PucR family transcriptional regulator n=1 Tax=Kribbella sp. VKM Ac-2571 TaxID=2512222 RepID=UPI00105EC10B|nr:helix-turn-helix domain-containing protein [Kribbella sp. VKM Ac-2571]TDO59938.1 DNA-binding PucR family transcriptional regulator [Kribbella sp. VKM Ac-2571]
MLLAELLDAPELGLRLMHSAGGTLDRPIGRLVTTDLLEPGRYLSGGEVVLTGLVWRRQAADSEVFVASMAGRGATTILAGKAQLGDVPADLLEACRRHDVTLVEVPIEVAFADVTEYVAAAGSAETGARLSASLVRQRQLLSSIAAGRSLDELAARISAEIGHDCRVLTPTGRHVVPGPSELDAETVDAVTRRFLTADRMPAVAVAPKEAGGSPYSLFPVGSGFGNRLTAWVLVIDGDHTTWSRDHVEAVHELSAIAALDRARRDEGRRALRPLVADALALVESGAPQAEVAARLRQAGAHSERPMVVAVTELREDGHGEVALSLLEDVALTVGPAVVAPGRDDLLVAFLPFTPELPEQLRRAFGRLAPGLNRARLTVGISGETSIDALAGALEEARFAQRAARAARAPVSVVTSDEVASHVLLLGTLPDDVRRTYSNRVLGAVLDHDRRTHADLLMTLQAFLACSCSWTRTAEYLHLHVNTVRYRIERVEQLTGRDLSTLEDRVDVFLACKSL